MYFVVVTGALINIVDFVYFFSKPSVYYCEIPRQIRLRHSSPVSSQFGQVKSSNFWPGYHLVTVSEQLGQGQVPYDQWSVRPASPRACRAHGISVRYRTGQSTNKGTNNKGTNGYNNQHIQNLHKSRGITSRVYHLLLLMPC